MSIAEFSKSEIALRQIETALSLYFQGGDHFSVITLAGAAEEILGQLRKQGAGRRGCRSILEVLRPAKSKAVQQQSFWGDESESSIHMDPDQEAAFLLSRAIEDFEAVTGGVTEVMLKFRQQARGRG